MLFLFFGLFCEPALTFPKTIDKPSMSMVSHKIIHSMAMVGLEKKTLEKPLIPMVEIWKTIEKPSTPMVHMSKNHWKTIEYTGTLTKTINHSIVVKILPSLRSNLVHIAKIAGQLWCRQRWCSRNWCAAELVHNTCTLQSSYKGTTLKIVLNASSASN